MTWLSRSVLFLAIALLFVAAFLGLNRLGALSSFEMTGRPGGPPGQTQPAPGGAPATTAGASAPSTTGSAGQTTPGTAPAGGVVPGPGGDRRGGFQWGEIGKDLGLVALAWLVLAGLDWLVNRRTVQASVRR